LDGWRAISIILVLGGHSRRVPNCPALVPAIFDHVVNAQMGVRCFFVISGLLITWLLIGEQQATGEVSLRHFYIRRALRILPVYYTFLAVLLCLQWLTPFAQNPGNWIANLTFTTNFFESSWPSGHLWSLAVEEQFYLVWPVFFVFAGLALRPRRALVFLMVPLAVAPVWRLIGYKGLYPPALAPLFTLSSFFNHFDGLAAGCICAFLLRFWKSQVEQQLAGRRIFWGCVGLGWLVLSRLLSGSPLPGRIVVAIAGSMECLGFGVLLMQSILLPRAWVYAGFNLKWVRQLGVLSYSIYIWQQIFCTDPATFGFQPARWLSFPGWMVAALVTACGSYYLLEMPFIRLRKRFK
jgi:peptidoglycan/LPS O-acetylase OafA/YrhL